MKTIALVTIVENKFFRVDPTNVDGEFKLTALDPNKSLKFPDKRSVERALKKGTISSSLDHFLPFYYSVKQRPSGWSSVREPSTFDPDGPRGKRHWNTRNDVVLVPSTRVHSFLCVFDD